VLLLSSLLPGVSDRFEFAVAAVTVVAALGVGVVALALCGDVAQLDVPPDLPSARVGRDRTDAMRSTTGELGMDPELATSLATALSLAELVDVSQMGCARHSQVVGRYAETVGERLSPGPRNARRLRLAGVLHDVGKIAVSGSILAKPGPLTEEEKDEMRIHPEVGARIARNAGLTDIAEWIACHHERPDGRGYPRGLTAAEIPIEAMIIAVADAYEAMTNDRAYRCAMSSEQAREELLRHAGTKFHPRVVDCFVALLDARVFELRVMTL
jgi:HD-GYP domain-containing protein (c-di-GMP phosphodiesterase class II)